MLYKSLTERQQLMLQIQRQRVIESNTDEEDEDTVDEVDETHNMQQPMARVFAIGKMNKLLNRYTRADNISTMDKRLLKGFYTQDVCELEYSGNETMYEKNA